MGRKSLNQDSNPDGLLRSHRHCPAAPQMENGLGKRKPSQGWVAGGKEAWTRVEEVLAEGLDCEGWDPRLQISGEASSPPQEEGVAPVGWEGQSHPGVLFKSWGGRPED